MVYHERTGRDTKYFSGRLKINVHQNNDPYQNNNANAYFKVDI